MSTTVRREVVPAVFTHWTWYDMDADDQDYE